MRNTSFFTISGTLNIIDLHYDTLFMIVHNINTKIAFHRYMSNMNQMYIRNHRSNEIIKILKHHTKIRRDLWINCNYHNEKQTLTTIMSSIWRCRTLPSTLLHHNLFESHFKQQQNYTHTSWTPHRQLL